MFSSTGGRTPGNFYPRPPRGGRPVIEPFFEDGFVISIHALREEGDLNLSEYVDESWQFLSTPSARRATHRPLVDVLALKISIHALREEGDSKNRDKISIFKQIIQHSARI